MKKKILLLTFLVSSTFSTKPNQQVKAAPTIRQRSDVNLNESENVLDYVDVLKTYYDLAIGSNLNPTQSFDEFYDSFYSDETFMLIH